MTGILANEPLAPCANCGRPMPAEELIMLPDFRTVCGPCQAEAVAAEERRDSIDAAWASVEATLPKGWNLSALTFMGVNGGTDERPAYDTAGPWWQAGATLVGEDEDLESWAFAETPAKALRALARKFADRKA